MAVPTGFDFDPCPQCGAHVWQWQQNDDPEIWWQIRCGECNHEAGGVRVEGSGGPLLETGEPWVRPVGRLREILETD